MMYSLRPAAVQYTNYSTGGAFELPTQSGTYTYIQSGFQFIIYIATMLITRRGIMEI